MGTWIKINRVNTVSIKTKSYFTITLAVLEGTIVHTDKANLANIVRSSAKPLVQRVSKNPNTYRIRTESSKVCRFDLQKGNTRYVSIFTMKSDHQ